MGFDEDLAARAAAARDVALFRYGLIRAAADPDLPGRQRGELVRALAAARHKDPGEQLIRVGRSTLDRWIRAWRAGGFDALVPGTRNVPPRTSAGVLELAVALKKEKPERTAAQVHRVLAARLGAGGVPSVRTIQRHFVRMELAGLSAAAAPAEVFGRFQADVPGELWVSGVLHGPPAGEAVKTYLFAVEDDHSRFLTGWWRATREDVTGLFTALRRAVEAHGAPRAFYVDNGSPYVSRQLLHALAVLGIQITHSRPRRPQGKGKIERLFETVRGQFLVEVAGAAGQAGTALGSVTDLEELFGAWVHQVYHQAVHGETGQAPAARFAAAGSRLRQIAPEAICRRRGILVAGLPHRHQDRHDQPARQPVPDRPSAVRPQGRSALQPGRPHHRDPGALARHRHGRCGAARDRPSLPPGPGPGVARRSRSPSWRR